MSLKESLKKIEDGNVLIIYCDGKFRAFVKKSEDLDLDKQTCTYLDCKEWPGLLDEGEWEWYLTQPLENSEIKDPKALQRIADQKDIPNKEYYSQS